MVKNQAISKVASEFSPGLIGILGSAYLLSLLPL